VLMKHHVLEVGDEYLLHGHECSAHRRLLDRRSVCGPPRESTATAGGLPGGPAGGAAVRPVPGRARTRRSRPWRRDRRPRPTAPGR
jgi:hypothetical protein